MGFGRPKGTPGKGERDVQVIPGRWENGCVCICALCASRAGTRGPFHAPPQLKPRYEVKSGKKRQEGSRTGHQCAVCELLKKGDTVNVVCREEKDVKTGVTTT